MKKRVLFISDTHCGSRVGLTPPEWQYKTENLGDAYSKFAKVQIELWNFYAKAITDLQPIDILIHCGDAIDGKGERSGSSECITADRTEQTEMAAACINYAKANKVVLHYGTPYHVGTDEDWEKVLADKITAETFIEGHSFPLINGVQFDIKHKIGSSGIPHGRFSAIARDKLWNTVWHSRAEQQPKAGVLIRGHVHYYAMCEQMGWRAFTMPALQGYGSKYGTRQCSGTVDIGMIVADITDNGSIEWNRIDALLPQQTVQPLTL